MDINNSKEPRRDNGESAAQPNTDKQRQQEVSGGAPQNEPPQQQSGQDRGSRTGITTIVVLVVVLALIIGGIVYLATRGAETETAQAQSAEASFSNLPILEMGVYEGWAIYGDEKVSLGTFRDPSSNVSMTSDDPRSLADADQIVITIEPENDSDPKPSGVVVLAGTLTQNSAELSFPVSFDDAAGSYILATPTNGGSSNETSGIWFLSPPQPLSASLTLPNLPNGWVYEGWAVVDGTPVTSGRFSAVDEADAFDGFSGEESAPPFPGEDYLTNAPDGLTFPTDLANGSSKVVVSVEPDMGGTDPTGDAPFSIKPLTGDIPQDAADHSPIDLNASTETVPSGSVQLQ